MYSVVLIAAQYRRPLGPSSQNAYYEEFGTVPFAGIRATFRASLRTSSRTSSRTVAWCGRALRGLRAIPSRGRRAGSVL